MHSKRIANISRKLLICGVLCLFATHVPAVEKNADTGAPMDWATSAFHSFGAPESILDGTIQVADEGGDTGFRAALSAELKRLRADLHERNGWADPLSAGDPLRIYVARRDGQGLRRLAARAIDRHRLVGASIEVDATGLSPRETLRAIARLYAQATLDAYGAPDHSFLSSAVAEALSAREGADDRFEVLRAAAAAPGLDLSRHADSFGRVYVEEFARSAGATALRTIWERAAQSGEEVLPLFLRTWTETTGEKDDLLLLRSAARMYTLVEAEPSPSRVGLADLQSGALDAVTPPTFAARHRTFLPAPDATGALKVAWPERGASAAAVVRYRDPALPPDVVFWAPGTTRTLPLSGVSRIDWVVGGTAGGPPLEELSASVEPVAAFPFANLVAQASVGPGAPRISWTTSGHEGLAGWALFREEVLADGRVVRTGPQILPSTPQAEGSFRYAFMDSDAAAGTFYRYSVWAVTDDGLLARAFSATLRTAD
ncbi:MAG: hypothetical protein LC796_06955 [Acidobacteria bacterium]|nr:hypothetical protein [Acidobacteriota bacterium]MCA1612229.1 hypothetical protein [Acidobacteriota bacterium]